MSRMAANIRKNDQVMVIAGRDKGKIGRVLRCLPEESRLVVEKVNLVKRHTKPNQKNRQGGIIEKEASIHVSNVLLVDPKTGKPTRVGRKLVDGEWVRVSKKSNEVIEIK